MMIQTQKIGNDSLLYLMIACAFYFAFRWLETRDKKNFLCFSFAIGLTILTKSNGLILLAMWLALALEWFYRVGQSTQKKRTFVWWLLPSLFVFVFFFGLNSLGVWWRGGWTGMIGNSSGLAKGLDVGISWENYLMPGFSHWFHSPYTHPWKDEFGRPYFLGTLYKSAFFGEFRFRGWVAYSSAYSSLSLFILLTLLGLKASLGEIIKSKKQRLLLLGGFASLCALGYLRYQVPKACSTDFRYVLPWLLVLWIPMLSGLLVRQGWMLWVQKSLLFALLVSLFIFDGAMLLD